MSRLFITILLLSFTVKQVHAGYDFPGLNTYIESHMIALKDLYVEDENADMFDDEWVNEQLAEDYFVQHHQFSNHFFLVSQEGEEFEVSLDALPQLMLDSPTIAGMLENLGVGSLVISRERLANIRLPLQVHSKTIDILLKKSRGHKSSSLLGQLSASALPIFQQDAAYLQFKITKDDPESDNDSDLDKECDSLAARCISNFLAEHYIASLYNNLSEHDLGEKLKRAARWFKQWKEFDWIHGELDGLTADELFGLLTFVVQAKERIELRSNEQQSKVLSVAFKLCSDRITAIINLRNALLR